MYAWNINKVELKGYKEFCLQSKKDNMEENTDQIKFANWQDGVKNEQEDFFVDMSDATPEQIQGRLIQLSALYAYFLQEVTSRKKELAFREGEFLAIRDEAWKQYEFTANKTKFLADAQYNLDTAEAKVKAFSKEAEILMTVLSYKKAELTLSTKAV